MQIPNQEDFEEKYNQDTKIESTLQSDEQTSHNIGFKYENDKNDIIA